MTSRDCGRTRLKLPSGDFSGFPAAVLLGPEMLEELLAEDDPADVELPDACEPLLPDLLHPATVAPTTTATSAAATATGIRLFITPESYLSGAAIIEDSSNVCRLRH
jgi:hypothetical protein